MCEKEREGEGEITKIISDSHYGKCENENAAVHVSVCVCACVFVLPALTLLKAF